jgi:hypothetical protein
VAPVVRRGADDHRPVIPLHRVDSVPVIQLENVTKTYPKASRPSLDVTSMRSWKIPEPEGPMKKTNSPFSIPDFCRDQVQHVPLDAAKAVARQPRLVDKEEEVVALILKSADSRIT